MKRTLLFFMIFSGTAVTLAATGVETPRLKPGLWEMRVQSSASGANSLIPSTICVGAMSDQQRRVEEDNIKVRCSKWESRESGGKQVIDGVCSSARVKTLTKHIVTSLNGDSFHEESTAPQGKMTSDGKWLGPCKPGQAPDTYK